jgi:uncharacterized protein with FMN-binding domain
MAVRAAVTLAAIGVGMSLALSFRTPPSSSLSTAAVPPPPSSSSVPVSTATATPSGAPPSSGSSPAPTSASTPTASGLKNGTFTGQTVTSFFGPIQVQIVVSGGRISGVKTLQSPGDNPQSAYIASVATPYLGQEVLKAQSAQINIVSGATYDSQSYAQSVQSALDMARA